MTICAQQSQISVIGRPIRKATRPVPSRCRAPRFLFSVKMVNVERTNVVESALGALPAQRFDDCKFARPISWVLVDRSTVLVPICLSAGLAAKLRFAFGAALAAFPLAAPSRSHVAFLSAIFPGSLRQTVRVNQKCRTAVFAYSLDWWGSFRCHVNCVSQYVCNGKPRYFDIACRRISDELKRPRFDFGEKAATAKQESFDFSISSPKASS